MLTRVDWNSFAVVSRALIFYIILHSVKLIQNFLFRCLCAQADKNDTCQTDEETKKQGIDTGCGIWGLTSHNRKIIPDNDEQSAGDDTGNSPRKIGAFPKQGAYNQWSKGGTKTGPGIGYEIHNAAVRIPCNQAGNDSDYHNGDSADRQHLFIRCFRIQNIFENILGSRGSAN